MLFHCSQTPKKCRPKRPELLREASRVLHEEGSEFEGYNPVARKDSEE
jgi:hypothetical protein